MNYLDYKAEDFAASQSFQNYYLYQKEEDQRFWERWIGEHPEKQPSIKQAKQLLDVLSIQRPQQSEIQSELFAVNQLIDRKASKNQKVPKPNRRRLLQWISGAVAASLLLFTSYYFFFTSPDPVWISMQTAFGEMKEIQLPDGSTVYLNSNSLLKYDSLWPKEATRAVWLEGEAFFDVTQNPTKGARPFVVHGANNQVEVLGTVFNVYNRQKSSIVLESGRVAIHYQANGQNQTQEMLPNELFEIDVENQTQHFKNINTQLYTAWKENKLVLDQTPLKKVVDILEENFGFEVTVKNKSILDRKLTATIPIIDITILLDALREIYGLKVHKEDRNIWIE